MSDAAGAGRFPSDPAAPPPAAPRLGPREYIYDRITRVGIFRRIDPSKPGRVWSRWEWLAMLAWIGIVVGSVARAWRRLGGPLGAAERGAGAG